VLTQISQEREACLAKFKKLEAASNLVETQQYAGDAKAASKRTEKIRKKCFKLFSAHEQNITDASVEQQRFVCFCSPSSHEVFLFCARNRCLRILHSIKLQYQELEAKKSALTKEFVSHFNQRFQVFAQDLKTIESNLSKNSVDCAKPMKLPTTELDLSVEPLIVYRLPLLPHQLVSISFEDFVFLLILLVLFVSFRRLINGLQILSHRQTFSEEQRSRSVCCAKT